MRAHAYIGLTGLLLVTACSGAAPVREKAYYAAHETERSAAIVGCRNDPGGIGKTPNCINAAAAAADVESSRFWAIKKPQSRLTNPRSL
jgi:hypothetical protein